MDSAVALPKAERKYDLEERTHLFGWNTREFVKKLPRTIGNIEDGKQLIRSSGSVGANYIEANEALSPKDRVKCFRIARKEAKESIHWLRFIDVCGDAELERERQYLLQEARELLLILSSILQKHE